MFPIGRNERYFVAIWIVDQESRYAIIHPMNNDDRIRKGGSFSCAMRATSASNVSRGVGPVERN